MRQQPAVRLSVRRDGACNATAPHSEPPKTDPTVRAKRPLQIAVSNVTDKGEPLEQGADTH